MDDSDGAGWPVASGSIQLKGVLCAKQDKDAKDARYRASPLLNFFCADWTNLPDAELLNAVCTQFTTTQNCGIFRGKAIPNAAFG